VLPRLNPTERAARRLIALQEKPDIDSLDRENPLAVTEYVNDIFSYWFRVEVRPIHNSKPPPKAVARAV
jgi:hypothetical protein